MEHTGNMDVRNKKFAKNGFWALLQQLVAVLCGLLLPQFILSTYGSAVNGLLASIAQFLSFITLLQGGVSTVARIAFYKPLAERDNTLISVAYKTVGNFFKKFSAVFTIYMILVAVAYPLIFKTGFSFTYVFWLVIVVGLGSISEYFFGQASQILLYSDQKGYIYSFVQIICLITSTVLCCGLIKIGASIHVVKLIYSIVFTIRPLVLYCIVKKQYAVEGNVNENKKLLAQKNAALIRHVAYYIHMSTDIVVLTIFMNSLWVSVYSVHKYVVSCLSNLITSIIGNSEMVFGDMFAKNEKDKLSNTIPIYDLFTKFLVIVIFSTCIILITSFVQIYTKNVNDISYYYPVFATVLVLGEMIYCMGMTYQNVYIAAGHIKKTEWIAIIEAVINIVISVICVSKYGISGVAIGTLIAMTFKTVANMYYMNSKVFHLSTSYLVNSNVVSLVSCFICCILFMRFICYVPSNYLEFFTYATIVFIVVCIICASIFSIFFRKYMRQVLRRVIQR